MLSGAAVYLSARVVAAIATLLSLYLFLRYSIEGFSVYVTCTTAGSILNGLMFQGIRMAYQRFNRGEDARYFNSLTWTLFFSILAVVSVACLLISPMAGDYEIVLLGSAAIAISQGWFELRLETLRLADRRLNYALCIILRSILLLLLGVFLARQSGWTGVFVTAAFLSYVGASLLMRISDIAVRDAFPWDRSRSVVFVHYAVASGVAVTATLLAAMFDRLAVAHFFDSRATAAYGVASSISQAGIAAVGQSIGLVSLPIMLRTHARSAEEFARARALTGDLHAILTMPTALVSALVSFEVFTVLGSPDVGLSTNCYAILSLATLLQCVSTYYYAQLLQVENAIGAYRNILVLAATLTSAGSPIFCWLIGVEGASYANLLAQCVCFVLVWRATGMKVCRATVLTAGLASAYVIAAFLSWWRLRAELAAVTPFQLLMLELAVIGSITLVYIAAYFRLQKRMEIRGETR